MSSLSKLKGIEKNHDVVQEPRLAKLVNFSGSYNRSTHRWFRYREGFSPGLLEHLEIGNKLFDPFCGCGTALIEAGVLGINSVGTDVNPLAVFIAKVKTARYSESEIAEFQKWFKIILSGLHRKRADHPEMPLINKLFQPQALDELLRIKEAISKCSNEAAKNLLTICWLNIIEPCSNVYKEGNGLKYRNKKRVPGKYETIPDKFWIPQYFGDDIVSFVRSKWAVQGQNVLDDLINHHSAKRKYDCTVLEKSCLDSDLPAYTGSCDTALFSPPYANRFDYFEAFKVELWMGDFVKSQGSLKDLRNTSLRNNLTVRKSDYTLFSNLENLLDEMDEDASSVRMGIKNTLRGYFTDMYGLGQNLKQILGPQNGKIYCVVGNSAYAGVIIPTDLLVAEAFEKAGLKIDKIKVARHLTVSSQQRNILSDKTLPFMRESVICASA